ncbi:copper resistance CopC/CopD family protein [Castellaniella sp.]|uniref:copper resistance CopC/CopD family protein n=1 Tax=Castellaniella sp. TaxID=1955812 RepID=UPI003A92329E
MIFARLVLACLLIWSSGAWGHAALISSTPAAGAVLAQAPATLTLQFSEPVGVTVLRLINPAGRTQDIHTSGAHDATVQIDVAGQQAPGTYLLSWRVVSADGHPIGGTLDYRVGLASAAGTIGGISSAGAAAGLHAHLQQLADPGASERAALIWASRFISYVCLFLLLGACAFRALNPYSRHAPAMQPVSQGRLWRMALGVGFLLLPLQWGLQGLDLLGAPWQQIGQPAVWVQTWYSSYATTLILLALAFGTSAWGLSRPMPAQNTRASMHGTNPHESSLKGAIWRQRLAGILALLLAGSALAVSGHAGTAPPRWLSRPTVVLHVISAVVWIGLLLPLARCLVPTTLAQRTASDVAIPELRRFSRGITWVVALLVLSGLCLAWLQLRQLSDLWQTLYGQVLSAKLTLVALLFCVAAWNRWRLTQATQAGALRPRAQLRRAIQVELVLAVLILGLVALWRLTPPPRSMATVPMAADVHTLAHQAAHRHAATQVPDSAPPLPHRPAIVLHNADITAKIQPGPTMWQLTLQHADGTPFVAQAVEVQISNPEAGIQPLHRTAQATDAPGHWQFALPPLPDTGHWQVGLEILVNDFQQVSLSSH